MKYFSILFLSLMLLASCQQFGGSGLSEGEIVYEITYLNMEDEQLLQIFLPEKMTIKFKDNKTISNLQALFGMFEFGYISNPEKGHQVTLVGMNNQQYYYEAEIGTQPIGNEALQNIEIKKTNETKEILGYKCQKAIVSFPDESKEPFEVFYTHELDIENPNINNPYKAIDGMLLEFRLYVNNMDMLLKAKTIKEKEISDSVFNVPSGYEKVSREELEEILKDS